MRLNKKSCHTNVLNIIFFHQCKNLSGAWGGVRGWGPGGGPADPGSGRSPGGRHATSGCGPSYSGVLRPERETGMFRLHIDAIKKECNEFSS